ncbi:MAG: MlaD family protein [Candidatus Anammoxibacter sp.]
METTDQRFISVERKVGIFIWIAITGIIALVAFIGIKQGIFTAKQTLYFFSDSGKDIKSGQTITLSGFKIGKVKNVLLEDITKVKVELSIYSSYMKWIKADAKAVLTKELPIGEGIIEIIPGSKDREEIGENGIIAFEKVPWFAAMTSNLDPIPITVVDSPQMAALISSLKENLKIEMAPYWKTLNMR